MSFDATFIAPVADAYVKRHAAPPLPILAKVMEAAQAEGQPTIGPAAGATLRALVASTGGDRVLEVGTNVGVSALWMASAMPSSGALDTIEIDRGLAERAAGAFHASGLQVKMQVHRGAALVVLPQLQPGYDLVFLDCVKSEYPQYLEHALRLVRVGGIIVADNCFWNGKAWDVHAQDADTQALREYARLATTDPRLVSVLLPVEDGLMVSVRVA